ncbi:MAG: AI-2E family transporter [Steroidobacteraceae bacterium]
MSADADSALERAPPIAGARPPRVMTAGKVLVLGALGLLLYEAHAAFTPIALALLFALILSSPVEALHRWRIPRGVSALLILVLSLALLGGAIDLAWKPAQHWFATAPDTLQTIKQRITPIARFMRHVDELRGSADTLAGGRPAGGAARTAVAVESPTSGQQLLLDVTRNAVVGLLTFAIVTLFLLAGGPPMLARMTSAFVDEPHAGHVLEVIGKVRAEVGRFYLISTVINIGLGIATAAVMMAWGMPNPYLWGVLAATLNYFPYVGPGSTLVVITIVAIVSFTDLGRVAGIAGSFVALITLEGQIVQPLLVGRRLAVNPLVVFLSLWFGGLFWGIAGIVLATPTLVAIKVVAANSARGAALLEFLGPNKEAGAREQKLRQFARRIGD